MATAVIAGCLMYGSVTCVPNNNESVRAAMSVRLYVDVTLPALVRDPEAGQTPVLADTSGEPEMLEVVDGGDRTQETGADTHLGHELVTECAAPLRPCSRREPSVATMRSKA